MEIGAYGLPGQHVMRRAKDLRPEIATIPVLRMKEKIVMVQGLIKNHVMEAIVQEMVIGALGLLGQHVLKPARDLRLEIATIPLLKMKGKIAKVLGLLKNHVMMASA